MLVTKALQVALLALTLQPSSAATTSAVKLCGRKLSDIMSRVCHAYNSPSWDDPTVEQPAAVVRRKRHVGIADQCCTFGCTWEQLNEYCAISAHSESPLDEAEAHVVAEQPEGTERKREAVAAPATAARGAGTERALREGQKNARPAAVVGTVSPLLTWGRTLNTDLPPERERFNYIAVYT